MMFVRERVFSNLQLVFSSGSSQWAEYSSFSIGDELSTNYTLTVSGYVTSSTAPDALSRNSHYSWWISNGQKFSTPDRDNDNAIQTATALPVMAGGTITALHHG
jgi:hypothetical protein